MDIKKELGLKIKRLRQKEGLTQEQFAEKLVLQQELLRVLKSVKVLFLLKPLKIF